MIFTKIEIDNLYCFQDFLLDLTFPKKKVGSTIPDEYLPGRPNFNYKKICVISGANASGKTAFGRVLCGIQNFISRKFLSPHLSEGISNKDRPSTITVEFVTTNDLRFHKLEVSFDKNDVNIENVRYAGIYLWSLESARAARKRLDAVFLSGVRTKGSDFVSYNKLDSEKAKKVDYFLSKSFQGGWMYLLANRIDASRLELPEFLQRDVLEAVLKTFDPSVAAVEDLPSPEDNDRGAFGVKFKNGDYIVVTRHGKMANDARFSRGTFESLDVAVFLGRMKSQGQNTTFFLDEQLAYSHSDIEETVLNTMIDHVGSGSQLFFTTHNHSLLDMNLPVHSFVFFRKRGEFTEPVQPENTFKKNDRSLLNAVRNDVFKTAPKTILLDRL